MYFVVCDPGHVSVCDVCICSDHMRKWRNLCYPDSDTNTYTCAWWDQTAKSMPYVRVHEADRNLCHRGQNQTHIVTKAETIPTPWRTRGTPDDLLLSRRSGSSFSRRQVNSYYNWDQNRCHQSDVNVNGDRMEMEWSWTNVDTIAKIYSAISAIRLWLQWDWPCWRL